MIAKKVSRVLPIVLLLTFTALLAGCGGGVAAPTLTPVPPSLEVNLILNPDISDVMAGQTIALNIEANGQGLQFKWSVTRGTLSAFDAPAVIYTAPATAGLDTVAVEVSSVSGMTTRSVIFNVIVPPTDTSAPTIPPTDTPLPLPLFEIFPQGVSGVDFVFRNNDAGLTTEFINEQDCVHSGIYALQLTYDMQGQANGGWGVHWVNPPAVTHFDASEFQSLAFWVRGIKGDEKFQVAMKDTNNREFWIESRSLFVMKKDWTMISIPLTKFEGVNTSSLENFTFGFNSAHGSGSICIDDIAFMP